MVDRVGAQPGDLHVPEALVNPRGGEPLDEELADGVADDVLAKPALLAAQACSRALVLQPPLAELPERERLEARHRFEPVPLPLRLAVEVVGEPLGLGLGPGEAALVTPGSGGVSVADVPALVRDLFDCLAGLAEAGGLGSGHAALRGTAAWGGHADVVEGPPVDAGHGRSYPVPVTGGFSTRSRIAAGSNRRSPPILRYGSLPALAACRTQLSDAWR